MSGLTPDSRCLFYSANGLGFLNVTVKPQTDQFNPREQPMSETATPTEPPQPKRLYEKPVLIAEGQVSTVIGSTPPGPLVLPGGG